MIPQLYIDSSAQISQYIKRVPKLLPAEWVRHGERIISLPVGICAEVIADLVKALNHHV